LPALRRADHLLGAGRDRQGAAGILESDSPDQAAEKLAASVAAAVQEASERDWFTARLAPLVGAVGADGGGSAERAESFTAWRRFLEALASSRPLVLVLEDLHWADPPLLEFVEHALDWAAGVPLLVVCTARPELYERNAAWGGGNRNSTTVALSPLTAEETARLLSALLVQAVLPAETQAALLERAGGNPLYAEEFVRMLRDRGILAAGGRPIETAAGEAIAVPETVQALIAARVDTLAPERKALLHDAAVVGKVFWAGAVASIGERDEDAVRQGLHELVQKELVRPVRTSSVIDQDEFCFWHVLIRDVAYAQIPRAARARKHQAVAAWIEGIAEDRVADHAEILVHHYAGALELARAAGADTHELEERTKHFLVLAGRRALRLDVAKAESYFRQALELLAPGSRSVQGRWRESPRPPRSRVDMPRRKPATRRRSPTTELRKTTVQRGRPSSSSGRSSATEGKGSVRGRSSRKRWSSSSEQPRARNSSSPTPTSRVTTTSPGLPSSASNGQRRPWPPPGS